MAFQTPITITEACDNIHKRRYILPDIQREFVWSANQIECLFDSLMRGYPIGSFLFWKLDGKSREIFRFYDFIRDYDGKNNKRNPVASTKKTDGDLTAILDGQQRLTALYIGLRGSCAYRKKYWSEKRPNAYPQCFLYLDIVNIIEKGVEDNGRGDFLYNFKFLEEIDAQEKRWFKVGKILDFKNLSAVVGYINENKLGESKILVNFYEVMTMKKIINFYKETHTDIDQVLDIFVRTNSGGTVLSKSDLLLSTVTAQWKDDITGKSAREQITEFVDEINGTRGGFDFSKDFVLKCCLMLADINVEFLAKNLTEKNIKHISASWEKIKESIRASVNLIAEDFGYDGKKLTSANAVIPIAYYFMKRNGSNALTTEIKQAINKWMVISLVKGLFGGSGDTVLTNARRAIKNGINKNSNNFPWQNLKKEFSGGNKTLNIIENDIDNMLDNKRMAFSILTILYPDFDLTQHFEVDHIFPRAFFKKINSSDKKKYTESENCVANLQFLRKVDHTKKTDKEPLLWLKEIYGNDESKIKEWKEKNYIGDLSLGMENFLKFYEQRRKKMKIRLIGILNPAKSVEQEQ